MAYTHLYTEVQRNGRWQAVLEKGEAKDYSSGDNSTLSSLLIGVPHQKDLASIQKNLTSSLPSDLSRPVADIAKSPEHNLSHWDSVRLKEILDWKKWDVEEEITAIATRDQYERYREKGEAPLTWRTDWNFDMYLFCMRGMDEDWQPEDHWEDIKDWFEQEGIEWGDNLRRHEERDRWRLIDEDRDQEYFFYHEPRGSSEGSYDVGVFRKDEYTELIEEEEYSKYQEEKGFENYVDYYVRMTWTSTYREMTRLFWEEVVPQLKPLSFTDDFTDVRCILSYQG